MKQYVPIIIVALAIAVALLSILGDESFAKLTQFRSSISAQKDKNDVLSDRVNKLRQEVAGLQTNDRVLEKAARNELGMARPNEMIFLFEEPKRDIKRENPEPAK